MTAITSIKVNAFSFGKAQASVFLGTRDNFNAWDRDFFDSEAFLALSEAINDYQDGRGYSVVSFLEHRVQNRLKNAVKREIRTVGVIPIMVRDIRGQIHSKVDFEQIMAALEPRDAQIFYLYFVEDKTVRQVGKIVGLSYGRVQQLLKGRIKKKVMEVVGA